MEEFEKRERIAVITGGSSGIGREIAAAFARNGDRVVIIGRNEETLAAACQAIGAGCSWERADVSQHAQIAAAVNAIVTRLGR